MALSRYPLPQSTSITITTIVQRVWVRRDREDNLEVSFHRVSDTNRRRALEEANVWRISKGLPALPIRKPFVIDQDNVAEDVYIALLGILQENLIAKNKLRNQSVPT